MLPTQPFYNEAISARPYDLARAKEYLQKAGYQAAGPPPPPTIPSFVLGMSTSLFGTYTEPSTGNILPNREILLMETTNNETYTTSAMQVDRTVTDLTGFYQFTVTPTNTGTSYYYILDRQAAAGNEWKYITDLEVSSLQSVLTPIYNAVNSTQQQTSQMINELQSQVDALQGSITTSTYVGYAAIVIAIVLGIIAVAMARRR